MVKEIVFTCDPCGDGRTPATHVGLTVALGKRKPRMLDLCDVHHEQLIAPVIEALSEWGYADAAPVRPAPKPAPVESVVERPAVDREGPYQCGLCEQQPKHIKSLSNHLRGVHGITLAAFRSEHGDPVLVA